LELIFRMTDGRRDQQKCRGEQPEYRVHRDYPLAGANRLIAIGRPARIPLMRRADRTRRRSVRS
jgi:hypothetical protein